MASGKKSALLSSLADYGDDSEPDSEPEQEEAGMWWKWSSFWFLEAKNADRCCANLHRYFHV